MHYDPLGMPAMLTQGESRGQQIVMDGWRPLLFANRFGSLTGLVIWVGSLPVAWIQAGLHPRGEDRVAGELSRTAPAPGRGADPASQF
jgi:hypothetical protein